MKLKRTPQQLLLTSGTSLALIVGLAAPAQAATSYKPRWGKTAPKGGTVTVDFKPVTLTVSAHLSTARKTPWTKWVSATVSGPRGWKRTVGMRLGKGQRHANGTWWGRLTLPPEAPGGQYKVSYTATSNTKRRATRTGATFKLRKPGHAPIYVWPGSPIKMNGKNAQVSVTVFRPGRTSGGYTTITSPRGQTMTSGLSLNEGTTGYGRWRSRTNLPASATPGRWKVTSHYTDTAGGTWRSGPATTFTVKQKSSLPLKASPTRVRRGDPTTLTGRLTAWLTNGKYGGLGRQKLQLMFLWNAGGAAPQKIQNVTTDRNGNFKVRAYAARSGWFYLTYGGASLYQGTRSPKVYITVR